MLSVTVSLFFHIFFIFITFFIFKKVIIDDLFSIVNSKKKELFFFKKKIEKESIKNSSYEDIKNKEILDIKNKNLKFISDFFKEENLFFSGSSVKNDLKNFNRNISVKREIFYEYGKIKAKNFFKKFKLEKI